MSPETFLPHEGAHDAIHLDDEVNTFNALTRGLGTSIDNPQTNNIDGPADPLAQAGAAFIDNPSNSVGVAEKGVKAETSSPVPSYNPDALQAGLEDVGTLMLKNESNFRAAMYNLPTFKLGSIAAAAVQQGTLIRRAAVEMAKSQDSDDEDEESDEDNDREHELLLV